MVDRWYYSHAGNRFGPCSGQQLKELAARGDILPNDTVWNAAIAKGALARRVQYLFTPAQVAAYSAKELLPPLDPDRRSDRKVETEVTTPGAAGIDAVNGAAPSAHTLAADLQPQTRPLTPARAAKQCRAVGVKGVVIVAQDGVTVRFRKKCSVCGHEDSYWNTAPITTGTTRISYFCPKCRKKRDGEIQCYFT